MTSTGAGASGASGIAPAAPAANREPARKAAAIILFMSRSPDVGRVLYVASAAGERNAGADFADRLIDQAHRALAMTALVRRGGAEFGAGVLQQADAGGHMRLRADGVADAHAGGDRHTEQHFSGGRRSRHVVLSFGGCDLKDEARVAGV